MKLTRIFCLGSFLLAQLLHASSAHKPCHHLYVQELYHQAFPVCLAAAQAGSSEAQNTMGALYQNGYGIKQNIKKALYWYRKAADQHNATAENNLGTLYLEGLGVPKDLKKAVQFYRQSAQQHNSFAQYNLGYLYRHGLGVTRNDQQALQWFQKSATNGYPPAQNTLGYHYLYGIGVPKNIELALSWYSKAVVGGNRDAAANLGDIYYHGVPGVKQDFQQSFFWDSIAAKMGDADAMTRLGYCYFLGRARPQNFQHAQHWFEKAAKLKQPNAMLYLGHIAFNDDNYQLANKWYRRAADLNFADGQYFLAKAYEDGLGVKQDANKALYWYGLAAKQNNVSAQLALGFYYYYQSMDPANVKKDVDSYQKNQRNKAKKWFLLAAKQHSVDAEIYLGHISYFFNKPKQGFNWYKKAAMTGDARAEFELAKQYEIGLVYGQPKLDQAIIWYQKAANQGHNGAQLQLAHIYVAGLGVQQDLAQAAWWYQQVAMQDNYYALYYLALEAMVQHSYHQAFKWLKAIIIANDVQWNQWVPWYLLGELNAKGLGVPLNQERAFDCYLKSANFYKKSLAAVEVGYRYAVGQGVTKNEQLAKYWLTRAVKFGDQPRAKALLKSMFDVDVTQHLSSTPTQSLQQNIKQDPGAQPKKNSHKVPHPTHKPRG